MRDLHTTGACCIGFACGTRSAPFSPPACGSGGMRHVFYMHINFPQTEHLFPLFYLHIHTIFLRHSCYWLTSNVSTRPRQRGPRQPPEATARHASRSRSRPSVHAGACSMDLWSTRLMVMQMHLPRCGHAPHLHKLHARTHDAGHVVHTCTTEPRSSLQTPAATPESNIAGRQSSTSCDVSGPAVSHAHAAATVTALMAIPVGLRLHLTAA